MSSKLTVVFYIVLCLEVGLVLTFLPWVHPFGLGDWGDNFFLLYAAQKTGLQGLQHAVASGWVRGAVSGLGVLNLGIALWEITHFRQTTRALAASTKAMPQDFQQDVATHAARRADPLSDYRRRDDTGDHAGL